MANKAIQDVNGNTSSKRLAGFVVGGCGLALILAVGITSLFMEIADPETALESGKILLVVGAGLLGIGVVEFFGKKS